MPGFDDPRVIAAIAGAIGAIVGGIIVIFNTVFLAARERRREQEKILLEYISPLRSVTEAMLNRLNDIEDKIGKEDKNFNTKWFMDIKNILIGNDPPRDPGIAAHYRPTDGKIDLSVKRSAFKRHANSVYYYPVSTFYLHLLFFHYSIRYRSGRVYLTRKRRLDTRINESLMAVRSAFNKNFDLYDVLQDSMGLFATGSSGAIPLSYGEFIDVLLDEERNNWVFNLLDKYAETFFHKSRNDMQARIQSVKAELTTLLKELRL